MRGKVQVVNIFDKQEKKRIENTLEDKELSEENQLLSWENVSPDFLNHLDNYLAEVQKKYGDMSIDEIRAKLLDFLVIF